MAYVLSAILIGLVLFLGMASYSQTGAPISVLNSFYFLVPTLILAFLIISSTYRVYHELGLGVKFYIACLPAIVAVVISIIISVNFVSSVTYKRGSPTFALNANAPDFMLDPLSENVSIQAAMDSNWRIESVGGTDTAEPITRVSLLNKDKSKTYFSSIYSGNCSIVDQSNLEVGQISGVTCWWAGGGNKVGVFNEYGVFVLKEGLTDEGSGGKDNDSVDKWVTTKEIKL